MTKVYLFDDFRLARRSAKEFAGLLVAPKRGLSAGRRQNVQALLRLSSLSSLLRRSRGSSRYRRFEGAA